MHTDPMLGDGIITSERSFFQNAESSSLAQLDDAFGDRGRIHRTTGSPGLNVQARHDVFLPVYFSRNWD